MRGIAGLLPFSFNFCEPVEHGKAVLAGADIGLDGSGLEPFDGGEKLVVVGAAGLAGDTLQ